MQNSNDASNSYNELEIVNANDIESLVEQCAECKINLLIYGEPGCGKSAIIEGLARDGKYNLVELGAATMCEEALNGFPTKDSATNQVVHTMPEWLAKVLEYDKREPEKKIIVFIDELTLARPEVANGLQTLCTARHLMTHQDIQLPENVVIVSATNTVEDTTEGFELSRPLKTRFMTVRMVNTPENYRDYIISRYEEKELLQNIAAIIGDERTRQFVDDTIADFRVYWCDNTRFYGTNPRTIMNFYKACDYVAKKNNAFTARDAENIAKRTVGHATATTNWVDGIKPVAKVTHSVANDYKYPTDAEIESMSRDELINWRDDISRSTYCSKNAAIMAICKINARIFELEKENN